MSENPASPKRILLVRNAMPYDFGGAERFPVHLAAEADRHGYVPVVASGQQRLLQFAAAHRIQTVRTPWLPWQNYSGIRVLLFPFYVLWQSWLFLWYLRLIVRKRIDILHPQSRDDFIAATFAGRLLGRRVVWTDHADLKYIYANHRVWYKNPVGKLVYLASRRADAITLVSYSEKQAIQEVLGNPLPPAYIVIHNGVFDEVPKPVRRPDQDADGFIFCATSRLVSAKGIAELIDAFAAVHERYPRARLWLVGDGPEAAAFKARAAGNTAITFIGHSDTPLSHLAAADVFVHPSYHEGFSLSLVEAAMLGKPIISCAVGGNPEIIRDGQNGLLVAARDPLSLRTAMLRLLEDRGLGTRLGSAARSTFSESYDLRMIVEREVLPLYEKEA
jgi:glycosyltransferase involved in cell wall biosynthesis